MILLRQTLQYIKVKEYYEQYYLVRTGNNPQFFGYDNDNHLRYNIIVHSGGCLYGIVDKDTHSTPLWSGSVTRINFVVVTSCHEFLRRV